MQIAKLRPNPKPIDEFTPLHFLVLFIFTAIALTIFTPFAPYVLIIFLIIPPVWEFVELFLLSRSWLGNRLNPPGRECSLNMAIDILVGWFAVLLAYSLFAPIPTLF